MDKDIRINYNGGYPNLCSGKLIVVIDDAEWEFPNFCLYSGGSVSFTKDWCEIVEDGEWSVVKWPKDFPEDLKPLVEEAVNIEIPHGCCGGCV